MKTISVVIALIFFFYTTIEAQHRLSITGGWTFSSLYKTGTPKAFENHYYYADLFRFSPIHMPDLGIKYTYQYKFFRFSTGISFLSLGTRDFFWKGTGWAHLYLLVPLLFGRQFEVTKNFTFTLEGGLEAGTSIMNVGSIIILGREQSRPYLGLSIGIEGQYKRFFIGMRGHLGLNNFDYYTFNAQQETLYFKHMGGTLYLGYTFWDSKKARERRDRRRNKKQLQQ